MKSEDRKNKLVEKNLLEELPVANRYLTSKRPKAVELPFMTLSEYAHKVKRLCVASITIFLQELPPLPRTVTAG